MKIKIFGTTIEFQRVYKTKNELLTERIRNLEDKPTLNIAVINKMQSRVANIEKVMMSITQAMDKLSKRK